MKHADQVKRVEKEGTAGGKEFGAAKALAEFAKLQGMLAADADEQHEANISPALPAYGIASLSPTASALH